MGDSKISLRKSIEESGSYAIILDDSAQVIGLWVSEDVNDSPIPEHLRALCIKYFGVDLGEKSVYNNHIH